VELLQDAPSVPALLGTDVHELTESYLLEGTLPDTELRRSWTWAGDPATYYPGRILAAALEDLPEPGTVAVELELLVEIEGVLIKVRPDYHGPGLLGDLKTIGQLRRRKGPKRLRRDPQVLLGAAAVLELHGGDLVEVRWTYATRSEPYEAKTTEISLERDEILEAVAPDLDIARDLLRMKATRPPLHMMEKTDGGHCARCHYRQACKRIGAAGTTKITYQTSLADIAAELEAPAAGGESLGDLLGAIQGAGFRNEDQGTLPKGPAKPKGASTGGGWRPPPGAARYVDLYQDRHGELLDSTRLCRETIGEVRRGETVHCITNGQWNMEDPIVHLADLMGPSDLYVMTWFVAMLSALRLAEARSQGYLRELRMVVDERTKVNHPQILDVLRQACGPGNLGIMACHGKAYVVRSIDPEGPAYTIVGSANLNRNSRTETIVIQEGRTPADFYASWIADQLASGRAAEYRSTKAGAADLAAAALEGDRK
jgi:hypothetical protein